MLDHINNNYYRKPIPATAKEKGIFGDFHLFDI